MKQKKINNRCRSTSHEIAQYIIDLACWDIDFNEFDLTKLEYMRRQIEKLWEEKIKV